MLGCGSANDFAQSGFALGCGNCYLTSVTIANNLIDNVLAFFNTTNLSNSIIEYNWGQNQWSGVSHGSPLITNNCHNSDVAGCSTAFTQGLGAYNTTFRYNIIKGCRGTACLDAIGPGNVKSMNAWKIYGNVLVDTAGGNGVIASGGSNFVIADTLIYNNTCVNCGVILHQCGANPACASASGNVVKNNIMYNGTCNIDVNLGSAVDNDYNAYLTCSSPETEANGQIATLDPFVNSAIGAAGDYHLTASGASTLNAGLTLASPYNQDMDGNTRGGDGKWDRGAYEFTVGTTGVMFRGLAEFIGLIFNLAALGWIVGRLTYGRTLWGIVALAQYGHARWADRRRHVVSRTDCQVRDGTPESAEKP